MKNEWIKPKENHSGGQQSGMGRAAASPLLRLARTAASKSGRARTIVAAKLSNICYCVQSRGKEGEDERRIRTRKNLLAVPSHQKGTWMRVLPRDVNEARLAYIWPSNTY